MKLTGVLGMLIVLQSGISAAKERATYWIPVVLFGLLRRWSERCLIDAWVRYTIPGYRTVYLVFVFAMLVIWGKFPNWVDRGEDIDFIFHISLLPASTRREREHFP